MTPGSTSEALTLRLLQASEAAVAAARLEDFSITFENATFFKVFTSDGSDHETLADRIPGFDAAEVRAKLEKGRPWTRELEVKVGPRTRHLRLTVSKDPEEGSPNVFVQAVDITKQREAEYMLDSYSAMAEKNARELNREKDRVEKLLLNLMPRSVYEELREYGTTTPQTFDAASVLMLDFAGFTDMAIAQDASAVVSELNDIFSAFDRIVELFDCERIKTIGDAYVAVAGLPTPNPDHALALARVALRIKRYLEKRNASHPTEWRFRIGLASGRLIGSMVGIQKYVYDIFGPAANLASRVEDACEPMTIAISASFYAEVESRFACTPLGEHAFKGFGAQEVYRLDFERPQ